MPKSYTRLDSRMWGRKGGLKGGRAGGLRAAANMTPQERSDRARTASAVRTDNLRRREAARLADLY